LGREEKGEEGDKNDLGEKKESQKGETALTKHLSPELLRPGKGTKRRPN